MTEMRRVAGSWLLLGHGTGHGTGLRHRLRATSAPRVATVAIVSAIAGIVAAEWTWAIALVAGGRSGGFAAVAFSTVSGIVAATVAGASWSKGPLGGSRQVVWGLRVATLGALPLLVWLELVTGQLVSIGTAGLFGVGVMAVVFLWRIGIGAGSWFSSAAIMGGGVVTICYGAMLASASSHAVATIVVDTEADATIVGLMTLATGIGIIGLALGDLPMFRAVGASRVTGLRSGEIVVGVALVYVSMIGLATGVIYSIEMHPVFELSYAEGLLAAIASALMAGAGIALINHARLAYAVLEILVGYVSVLAMPIMLPDRTTTGSLLGLVIGGAVLAGATANILRLSRLRPARDAAFPPTRVASARMDS